MAAKLSLIRVRNQRLSYQLGDPEATSAAASSSLQSLPNPDQDHAGYSIANADGTESYPMATFSYVLVRKDLRDVGVKGRCGSVGRFSDRRRAQFLGRRVARSAIKAFLLWSQSDEAQAEAIDLGLVPVRLFFCRLRAR